MASQHAQSAICPKCGYDQSGAIATWENQCPIEGTCPECGLGFAWANIIDPARVDLRWYIEHAPRKRDLLARSLPTLRRLLVPNLYWRSVGVSTRIEIRTLLLWLLLLLLFWHVLALVPVGLGNWQESWGMVRGGGFDDFVEQGVLGLLYELHNAIFAPFLRVQYGYYGLSYRLGGYFYQEVAPVLILPGLVALPSAMWLVLIWLLPVTRARSSLRTVHLVRAWLLTLIPVIVLFECTRIVTGLYAWFNGAGFLNPVAITMFALIVLSLVWVQWFWIAAMKVGWGIKPVWPIAVLGCIASLLTTAILIVSGTM